MAIVREKHDLRVVEKDYMVALFSDYKWIYNMQSLQILCLFFADHKMTTRMQKVLPRLLFLLLKAYFILSSYPSRKRFENKLTGVDYIHS